MGYRLGSDGRLVHRVVWESAFGKIPRGWEVHHCDKDKLNNALDNLVALPRHYHEKIHRDQLEGGTPLPTREMLLQTYHYFRDELAKDPERLAPKRKKKGRKAKDKVKGSVYWKMQKNRKPKARVVP